MAEAGFQYDLVVIGGGSGGLSCAKAAAINGAKVACLDFVKPSPQGTTWGLGGTCVNVGCIPKKLMHQAALLGHSISDARSFGWGVPEGVTHDWAKLVSGVQDHIKGLNWGYRVELREKNVTYLNAYGTLVDPHTLRCVNRSGQETIVTSRNFVVATGGRPKYPDIPGAELGITSDDLFSLARLPGKTLIVGASYVALECAGFLAGIGFEVTVLVRSILLRGYDQEIADMIGTQMASYVNLVRPAVPTRVEKDEATGRLRVTWRVESMDGQAEFQDVFDTVMWAMGRDPCTRDIGLDAVGVAMDSAGKIITTDADQTNVPSIYAIGDVVKGKPELTPVAIHAGKLLAERLFAGATKLCDYVNVATTVFTPLEYGCVGYAEDDAKRVFGEDNIEVYHQSFQPLEFTVAHRPENQCFAKLIVNKADNERVIGLHILGPNAGEVTQGFAIALKLRASKKDFDELIGIHPTVAETFTTMSVTKASGASAASKGC